MFDDWKVQLVAMLRDILSKTPDSIRLCLVILSFAVGLALAFLLYVAITKAGI